jgi:hypothetical protein
MTLRWLPLILWAITFVKMAVPELEVVAIRGLACSTFRAAEDDVWQGRGIVWKHLAFMDQFKFEIDRAFGPLKDGW